MDNDCVHNEYGCACNEERAPQDRPPRPNFDSSQKFNPPGGLGWAVLGWPQGNGVGEVPKPVTGGSGKSPSSLPLRARASATSGEGGDGRSTARSACGLR